MLKMNRQKKFALIIGNSDYEDTNLSSLVTPSQDVRDLKGLLENPAIGGFDDIVLVQDETAGKVRRTIAGFFSHKNHSDLLLLYFSGHSILNDKGHLYLALKDTETALLSGTAIPTSFITQEMDHCRSKTQIMILDCCHSGAVRKGTKGMGNRVGVASAFEGNGSSRIILTASDSTQFAWEGNHFIGEATHSLFTHYLIEGMKTGRADLDSDGWISIGELYDYAHKHVIDHAPGQTPGMWTFNQSEDIILAKAPAIPHDAKNTQSLIARGKSCYDENRYYQALYFFNQALTQYPQNSEVLELKLKCEKKMEDNGHLQKIFEAGINFYNEQDYHKALEKFNKILSLSPSHTEAGEFVAKIQKKLIQLDLINKLIDEASSDMSKKRYEAAIKIYKRIIDMDPANEMASAGFQMASQKLKEKGNKPQKSLIISGRPKLSIKRIGIFIGFAIIMASVWWGIYQSSNHSTQLNFSKSFLKAKEEMLEQKELATHAQADRLAGETFSEAKRHEMAGNTETDNGNQVTARLSYNMARDLFARAVQEATIAKEQELAELESEKAKENTELENSAKIAQLSRQRMIVEKSGVDETGANSKVREIYNSALSLEQQGNQEFEAGNYSTADQLFSSAREKYSRAQKEIKKTILEEETDLQQIKQTVTEVKSEVEELKVKAELAESEMFASQLFKNAIERETSGNQSYTAGTRESLMEAQSAFLDAKELYIRAEEQASTYRQLKKEAVTSKDKMTLAKQNIPLLPPGQEIPLSFQNASEYEKKANVYMEKLNFGEANTTYNQARQSYIQAKSDVEKLIQAASEDLSLKRIDEQNRMEIHNLVNNYSNSIEQGNISVLRQFIGPKDEKSWNIFFGDANNIQVQIQNENILIDGNNASVSFTTVIDFYYKPSKNNKTTSMEKIWRLSKSGDGWKLVSVN